MVPHATPDAGFKSELDPLSRPWAEVQIKAFEGLLSYGILSRHHAHAFFENRDLARITDDGNREIKSGAGLDPCGFPVADLQGEPTRFIGHTDLAAGRDSAFGERLQGMGAVVEGREEALE